MEDSFIFTQSIRGSDSWEQVQDMKTLQRHLTTSETPVLHIRPESDQEHSTVAGPDQGKHYPSGLLLLHLAPFLTCGHHLSSPCPESRMGKCLAQTYALILCKAHPSWRKHAVLWPPLKNVVRVGQQTWCVFSPTFKSLWLEILVSDSMKLSSIDPFIQQIYTECLLYSRPWGYSDECSAVPGFEGLRVQRERQTCKQILMTQNLSLNYFQICVQGWGFRCCNRGLLTSGREQKAGGPICVEHLLCARYFTTFIYCFLVFLHYSASEK